MNQGWVKLHRSVLEHPRFKDARWVVVWNYLLLNATHKPFPAIFDGKVIELQPGQLITGRLSIARATGVKESKVKRVLAQMQGEGQIGIDPGTHHSLVTVLNWQLYQGNSPPADQSVDETGSGGGPKVASQVATSSPPAPATGPSTSSHASPPVDPPNGQPVANHRPANGQLVATNKNVKNERSVGTAPARRVSEEEEIPSIEAVIAYGQEAGIPESYCRHYHERQSVRRSWFTSQGRLRNWRIDLTSNVWWGKDKATWGQGKPNPAQAQASGAFNWKEAL